MTAKEIQKILSVISPISEDTAIQLMPFTKEKIYKKGDLIEKSGQQIRYQIFVRTGVVRIFLADTLGNQHTVAFYSNNSAVTPALIRSVNLISFVNIEVISKEADVVLFHVNEMGRVMQGNKDLELFGYKILMQEAYQRAEREKILLTATGAEKLEWLRKYYPNIENKIPHYYICSFLGLTPTSLSRLRSSARK